METAGSGDRGTQRFVVTAAERQVADLLPTRGLPGARSRDLQAVPFWFHAFTLNRPEGIYTPGAARDHRYRVAMLPADRFAPRAGATTPPPPRSGFEHRSRMAARGLPAKPPLQVPGFSR